MNALLTLAALALSAGILLVAPAEAPGAILVCLPAAAIAALAVSRVEIERSFLIRLFIGAVLVRMLVGTIIYTLHLQEFFGGDANTYDLFGYALLKGWQGDQYYRGLVASYVGESGGGGWGMLYVVAVVYGLVGRNMLAIQFINAVAGAATAPLIAVCAWHIFKNLRVARIAALFVAFYPSLVLWSSQGLKDGPIVFLLALSIFATLKLGEKLSLRHMTILACSLFALLSLRFYIFYMMVAAIGGAFVIGMSKLTATSFIRQFVIVIFIGLALTYFGVSRYAGVQLETYGNLEAVQRSRKDLASGQSGFGKDVDVSSTSGALSVLPVGMLYLLFAPFPWQLVNLRQSITLPEMIIWWCSFPLLILGLLYTIKYHLRQVSPILIFTSMVTLAYSLFQGNVGTAYRQRSQLLVFYFIFVAVGFVLLKEKKEEKERRKMAEREEMAARLEKAARERRVRAYGWKGEPAATAAELKGKSLS